MPHTGHTPGPWKVPEDNPAIVIGVLVPGEEYGGGYYATLAKCKVPGRTHEEAQANAHLIAAAPDLHDLAEAVLLFHSAQPWGFDSKKRWWQLTGSNEATTRTLCDFARRVLDKVKGSE